MPHINSSALRKVMPENEQFLEIEGQKWREERQEKDAFFSKYFAEHEIDNLEEGTLRQLIRTLWAFNGWTNKEWLLQEMLTSGLPGIRKAFAELLYGSAPISERFDSFRGHVRMVGAASISEILAHLDAKAYPIWNRRSRQGLIDLGVDESALPKSSQISGAQYASFCELAKDVLSQVSREYKGFDDLLTLDFLLYFVSLHAHDVPATEETDGEDIPHNELITQVLELGDGLGFEVQKEYALAKGCRIDAIWRTRVANLGTIAYAFEVHKKGSRDSAILNLQRVGRDPSIQKVVVVSTMDELEAFKDEIATLDQRFANSVGYFDVSDLQRALAHLQQLKDILNSLGLLRKESSLG